MWVTSDRWMLQKLQFDLWLANPPAADRPSGVSYTKKIVGLMVVALWHHVHLSSSWHLLSPGMFCARPRLFFTMCCIANHEERVSWIKRAETKKRKHSVHRILIYTWRLKVVCSKHTHSSSVYMQFSFSWNTFWFPTDNQAGNTWPSA